MTTYKNGSYSLNGEAYDDKLDIDNLKWFHDKYDVDKIGINPSGDELYHDSMLYTLAKFHKIDKKINGKNTIQLIYKISNQQSNHATDDRVYFTDLLMHTQSNYLIYKYVEINNKMEFSHIVFNGKTFK